jgi:hypothetical protein
LVFTMKRFALLFAGAIAFFVGVPQSAEAGIRVRIDTGAETQWFYATSNTSLSTGEFTIGAYSGNLETTITNYPGTVSAGTMSQTLNIGLVGADPATITVQSWVVDDTTLGALSTGAITDAGQIASLSAAGEKLFQLPDTIDDYFVTTDAGSSVNATVTSGSNVVTTTVDGTGVVSLVHDLVVGNDGKLQALVPDSGTADEYSLNQLLEFSGANQGASGFNVTGSSSVQAVPEPATLAIWGLGAMGVLVAGRFRRKLA